MLLALKPWKTRRTTLSHWKTLKTLSNGKLAKQLKNLANVRRTEKNNSKQTNCMIEKYFLAFTIKWFALMFHIILHIIFPSCTSFSDFVFSENQSTCILFNCLPISILYIIVFQQTAEVLGNLTDFLCHFYYCFLCQS